ncbi:MAG: response regulator [Deltaproteobacteria bacterium]|nr:response regulator [Deltaproteobacteria bacterium]
MPKKLILIIEDDLHFQFAVQSCLKKEGYACTSVASVKEALERVRLSVPDLVILDLGLRTASGMAFLQNLEDSVSSGEKIPPVLVVSGNSEPDIVEMATRFGAFRFISKPVSCAEIVSAVHDCLYAGHLNWVA